MPLGEPATFAIERGSCQVSVDELFIHREEPGDHPSYFVLKRSQVARVVVHRPGDSLKPSHFTVSFTDQGAPPCEVRLPPFGDVEQQFEAARVMLQSHGWLSNTCDVCGATLYLSGIPCHVCALNDGAGLGGEGIIVGMDAKCLVNAEGITLLAHPRSLQRFAPPLVWIVTLTALATASAVALAVREIYNANTALVALGGMVVLILGAAATASVVTMRRPKDMVIPRDCVKGVVPQVTPGISKYGTYVIHYVKDGKSEQEFFRMHWNTLIQGQAARAVDLFRRNGWLYGRCSKCRHELQPGQFRCPECGEKQPVRTS